MSISHMIMLEGLNIDLDIEEKILYLVCKDIIVTKLLNTISEMKIKKPISWFSVSQVASLVGLTADAVRKQLQNGDFEEGLDFQYNGARIQVNQGAIERIQRKRRCSNG